jgi:hypothetical protein
MIHSHCGNRNQALYLSMIARKSSNRAPVRVAPCAASEDEYIPRIRVVLGIGTERRGWA